MSIVRAVYVNVNGGRLSPIMLMALGDYVSLISRGRPLRWPPCGHALEELAGGWPAAPAGCGRGSEEVGIDGDGVFGAAPLARAASSVVACRLHEDARVDVQGLREAEDDGRAGVLHFVVFELREVALAEPALRGELRLAHAQFVAKAADFLTQVPCLYIQS